MISLHLAFEGIIQFANHQYTFREIKLRCALVYL
uniref:Uncharacterized protein n=1 Tax=Setaria viridis TaxID=4556 RepID=A0A4U6UXR9_SETVI|nr:hypothetical protein SEVIR_4G199202v2 [Setaria viridis]